MRSAVWKLVIPIALTVLLSSSLTAEEMVFSGKWRTTNRQLDGQMTCVVKRIATEQWQGRFFGVWQGLQFDYTVAFTGPAEQLEGVATIDGASYQWKGQMDSGPPATFRGKFGGSRYEGSFDLAGRPQSNGQETVPQQRGAAR